MLELDSTSSWFPLGFFVDLALPFDCFFFTGFSLSLGIM
jgi:hypothetical protein